MPVDCSDCLRIKNNPGKGNDCPVNEIYKQKHDKCLFKEVINK